jgi:hypothetical protein
MSRVLTFATATALLFCAPSCTKGFAPSSVPHRGRSSATARATTKLYDSEQATLLSSVDTFQQSIEVYNPTVEFDIDAAEISAFTKTAAARAQMGKFDTIAGTKADTNKALESEFPKRRITASVRETGTDSMKNYIKSMCNHELLNKNEEIILAREIQILLKWEAEREALEEKLLR